MKDFTRLSLLVAFLLICSYSAAQSLSVKSFKLLENDLTANTYGTVEYDQNGQVAALIKVVTVEKGFVFDGGMLGIVRTVQKAGEIWVYVPYGLQRITISHPDFGIVRNYYFPIPIEKGRTYEMELNAVREVLANSKVDTYVDVSFENAMSSSDIYLNGIKIASGSWKGSIIATTYLIEVKQEKYQTYTTTVTLSPNDNGRIIRIPQLDPITGTISITSEPAGATVYLDGDEIGTSPLIERDVIIGSHKIELRKKNYRTSTMDIEVKENETNSIITELKDEFRFTLLSTPAGATLSLNGVNKGKTPYSDLISSGDYQVRLSKTGYLPYDQQMHLSGDNPEVTISLERIILSKTDFYLGGGYSVVGHITGIEAFAGAFIRNINIECGFLLPQNVSSTVWWMDTPSEWSGKEGLQYEYSVAYAASALAGWGILLGNRTRITPRIGARYNLINGKYLGSQSDMDQTSFVVSGLAEIRAEYSPMPHVGFICVPSYDLPLKMGDLASRIDATSTLIKDWCSGFSLSIGVELYF